MSPKEIGFDLKKACQDCPFKKATPIHSGVAQDLPALAGHIEMGSFMHSCHKTDPDSDGYNADYKGQIQHCAGAIVMLKKMGPDYGQVAWIGRRDKIAAIPDDAEIFESAAKMFNHYARYLKRMLM